MRKLIISSLLYFGFVVPVMADHITGGEMFYTLTGMSNGQYHYNVTLKLFMRCNSGRQFNNPTVVSVFNKSDNSRVSDLSIALTSQENISLTHSNPCITNPPTVCYEVGYYQFNVSLPGSSEGYVLASQVNYRIAGINNLAPNYGLIGALYTAEIPGTLPRSSGPQNNSAHFVGSDLVVVCGDNSFSYSFAAIDSDGDRLRYYFCEAYVSGSSGNNSPPTPPPYQAVPYGLGFSSSSPLGGNVQINSNTGLITGIAPSAGVYVVTVCVEEWRNNVVIAIQRKDLQIHIAPCNIAAAMLNPEYMLCRDTKTISLVNLSNSPLINSHNWEIFKKDGTLMFSSATPTVNYTFSDTGIYTIKLVINQNGECSDSTTSTARVYPGFMPNFNYSGICFNKPTHFTDLTTTTYGIVNSWNWDFGENFGPDDVSHEQHPTFIFSTMGTKNVRLITTNTKGCRDTVTKHVSIVDKPPITLGFRDTLICVNDQVRLNASGSGLFAWSPNVKIINPNSATPTVSPTNTLTYFVDLNDNGCLNRDSVKVRVTDHVNLRMMRDTTICQGDSAQLKIVSDGFQYSWTPASQCVNPNVANPITITNSTTIYRVVARIGGCSATNQVVVTPVPYPFANAGTDTIICHNTTAQLNSQSDGTSYSWHPASSLNNSTVLNPVARPPKTTAYILFAYDTRGCPKATKDTVVVSVLPDIIASAGRDTAVVTGQMLQFNASGGIKYTWIPSNGLSAANIPNPSAIYDLPSDGIRYKVLVYNDAGCVDSASIMVKIFKTLPSIFVPNAFTPNNDGKNDVLKPIAVGMKTMEYFKVYNRWGQLVFSTALNGPGWDGRVGNNIQPTGSFVWMAKAVDYTGKVYVQKGIVTLIR